MLDNPSSGIDAPAAFLVELVQGEGGLNAARPEWVRGIAALAKKHGAMLIVDDIQAGIGRAGTFFSFDEMGVEPDMVTHGEVAVGLSACRSRSCWCGPSTTSGSRPSTTAPSAATPTPSSPRASRWRSSGPTTASSARSRRRPKCCARASERIASRIPGARLKGRGMMQGVDVGSGELAEAICAEAFRNGLVIETSGAHDEVVKVLAPLTTPIEQFKAGLATLEAAAESRTPMPMAAE